MEPSLNLKARQTDYRSKRFDCFVRSPGSHRISKDSTKIHSVTVLIVGLITLYNVCSVHRGMFSTSGGYREYIGRYHEYIGGVQYTGAYHNACGGIS